MMPKTRLLSAFSIFLVGSTVVNGENNVAPEDLDCSTLNCAHGGTCVVGQPDYSDHPGGGITIPFLTKNNNAGAHCECPQGWTGIRCGRKYQNCNDGNHKCYNGGKCIQGMFDEFGNPQAFCDCRAASHDGKRYVGKYCQFEEARKCDDAGKFFCVNSGVCKANYADTPHQPCDCGTDYEGAHCEFKVGEVPDCTLKCFNEGECQVGLKAYEEAQLIFDAPFLQMAHIDLQYCSCKPGWTGVQCNIELSNCGDRQCLNGAKCMSDGTGGFHCDCNTANTPDVSFSGKYCEHASTTFCTKQEGPNGHQFCVNNGTCDASGLKCNCPDGFGGALCQFKKENEKPCNLKCENQGQCTDGLKDLGDMAHLQIAAALNRTHVNFQHCVCPEGFAGVRCEVPVETCGEGKYKHYCLHGSKCIEKGLDGNQNPVMGCDCSQAFTNLDKYAGDSCEHGSTSLCMPPGEETIVGASFCVNGGKCLTTTKAGEKHQGCQCPDGFYGDHCELIPNPARQPVQSKSNDDSGLSAASVFLVVVTFVVTLVVLGVLALIWNKNRTGKEDVGISGTEVNDKDLFPAKPADPVEGDKDDEQDDDGEELQNVEII